MPKPSTAPRAFHLQRYFSVASGILMLVVALPLAWVYRDSEVREHTALAGVRNEMLAVTYANALWSEFGAFLLDPTLDAEQRRKHPRTLALDARIKELARGANVFKIEVYNPQGRSVYSSDLDEIGEDKRNNSGFQDAMRGRQVNELTPRGGLSETEGRIAQRDLVSSYIPVRAPGSKEVSAVFELYSDVTDTMNRISAVTWNLLASLIGVFLVLYLCLLSIVARADRVLKGQYHALKENEARLQAKTTELEREIEERREIERALRQSEEHAAAANRAKSDFLSSMSHELRTPMNAILGFTQLLRTEPGAALTATQERFVTQILKSGGHLLELIDQVLDLARIQAGKLALSLEAVRLASLLEEVLPMVEHLAKERNIGAPRVDVDDLHVQADHVRLKQLLLNLLSNAVKYNRQGGSITIRAGVAGHAVRLAVSDTGMGIPEARLPELFQPFSRLDAAGGIEGTGIGLAFCKYLVEAMGGSIGVESTVGVGSTFWITLPLVPAPTGQAAPFALAASAPTAPGTAPASAPAARTPPQRTVLYIEDNPANVNLMEALVQRLEGVRLVTAHNAEFGLAVAVRDQPALIIMDINLPGMNGYAALTRLQADPATSAIPVIALTANAMPHAVERGLAAGFRGYYTKPIQIDVLSQAIATALDETAEQGGSAGTATLPG